MRVGVVLPMTLDDPGEFIADAAAFDAAGADWLWLSSESGQREVLILLAAVGAVARRANLGVALGPSSSWPPELLERSIATLRWLGRGRAVLAIHEELGQALDLDPGGGGEPERWRIVPVPESRAAWAEAIAAAEDAGAAGIMVPASPRLLDILRNPDPGEGRQDLLLAQG